MSRAALLATLAAMAVTAPGAAAQQVVEVTPGNPLIDVSRLHEGADTSLIRWSENGVTREGPTQIQDLAFSDDAGRPVLRLVTAVLRGGETFLADTSFFDRQTLAPISHVSHGGGRVLSLRYADGEVNGELAKEGEPATPIHYVMAKPLFDPSAAHLVLQTIEWKAGLAVAIPVFKHDQLGPATTTARPVGSEPVTIRGSGSVPAWVLNLDYGTHQAAIWMARDGSRAFAGSVDLPQDRRMTTLAPDVAVPSLAPGKPVVAPGAAAVDGSRLFIGTSRRVTTVTRPNGDTNTIDVRDDVVRTTTDGAPTLTRIQTISTPRGTRVDSAVVSRSGLVPRYHSGRMGAHSMQLYFDGTAVTGQYTPEDSTARPIDQALANAPYDSNAWDLVIAALPLAQGYTARLPIYWYEQGGLVWSEVAVTGSETVPVAGRPVDAWVVDADFNGRKQTLWIAKSQRRLVKSHTEGSGFTVDSTIE